MSNDLETLSGQLLKLPQVECPVVHRFAPGVYLREIHMPAGTMVIGHKHKTEHLNIILQGRCRVIIDGAVVEIEAPHTFISQAGAQKVLNVLEDTIWQTVHPTDETDVQTLESMLVEPSESKLTHEERKALTQS